MAGVRMLLDGFGLTILLSLTNRAATFDDRERAARESFLSYFVTLYEPFSSLTHSLSRLSVVGGTLLNK